MTQLSSLDDDIFKNIQENGSIIQSLDTELALAEHRISSI